MQIYQRVDLGQLYFPTIQQILNEDGWSVFRDYSPAYFGASWEEARLAVEWDKVALRRLGEYSKHAENSLLDEIDEEAMQQPSGGLDLGVGGAVVALSAAGCAPLTSCSGHFGEGDWISFPLIKFAADAGRVARLIPIAQRASCGMVNSGEGAGAIELWAQSVDDVVGFAEELIEQRGSFMGMIAPSNQEEEDAQHVHEGQGRLF